MTKGGARNRSGKPADPNSIRSTKSGYTLTALDREGYDGDVPAFPLSPRRIMRWEYEDKRRFQVFDEESTELVAEREAELWAWAWTTPQACAWSMEPWRWQTVAMWVRVFVICEGDEAAAADKGSVHRFADQIGMTPAGLKENGWAISTEDATDEAADGDTQPAKQASARDRMTVVPDAGAA